MKMMKYGIVLLALCGGICRGAAPAGDLERLLLISLEKEKVQWLFEIPAAKAEGLPKWRPDSDGSAPVSLQQASSLAKAALKKRHPGLDELEVFELRLKEISWSKRYGSWYYTVTCVARRDGKLVTDQLVAIILMDGTSVEPTIIRK
jgi:hypothetical protein